MESHKPTLVLLHGALGTQAQFDPLLPFLAGDFDVLTLNFEGHGSAAPGSRPFSIASFAENVTHLLDTRGIGQADIFGYSMGGYVALYLALTQPERVKRLFTLATKLDWTPESAGREAGLLDADTILAKVPRYAETLQAQHGAAWREVLNSTKALLLRLGERPVLTRDSFPQIQQRTRISLGDRDMTVSIEESLAAYRALPNGEFQIFPNAAHPLNRVSATLLAEAVQGFFV
jgi:pimeloyl-ACP methyl ester carboxylesterase